MNPTSHPCFTQTNKLIRKAAALETSLLQHAKSKFFFSLRLLQWARADLRAELAKKHRKTAGHAEHTLWAGKEKEWRDITVISHSFLLCGEKMLWCVLIYSECRYHVFCLCFSPTTPFLFCICFRNAWIFWILPLFACDALQKHLKPGEYPQSHFWYLWNSSKGAFPSTIWYFRFLHAAATVAFTNFLNGLSGTLSWTVRFFGGCIFF